MQVVKCTCDICRKPTETPVELRIGDKMHDLCASCNEKLERVLGSSGRGVLQGAPSLASFQPYSPILPVTVNTTPAISLPQGYVIYTAGDVITEGITGLITLTGGMQGGQAQGGTAMNANMNPVAMNTAGLALLDGWVANQSSQVN